MSRTINEDIKTLKTYKKEEILESLKHAARCRAFDIDLIMADMLSYLENKKRKEAFAAQDKAVDAKIEAMKAFQKWNSEICEKYGNGETCKLSDIPPDEIERGAALENQLNEAIKKAQRLDAKVTRLLGI